MAIGSLAGALLAARRERPRLRLVLGATGAFGFFASVAALMPSYALFAVALVPVGLSSLTLMTSANATVQLSVAPEMRGRVMALYMAIFMGGTPIGAPIVGWIGSALGPRWTILFGGLISLLTAVVAIGYVVRTKRLAVGYEWRPVPHLLVTTREQRDLARAKLAATAANDSRSAA
jgi:MFS family permease